MNYSYALTKHIPEIHAALISDILVELISMVYGNQMMCALW